MAKKTLTILLVLFFFGLGATMLVVKLYSHPSGSMLPSIRAKEMIFVFKLAYGSGQPAPGDVIAFDVPGAGGKLLTKRVVAVAGQRVGEKKGRLTIDGKVVAERIPEKCHLAEVGRSCVYFRERLGEASYRVIREPSAKVPLRIKSEVVKAGHVYVMGDNRDHSHDSRSFGQVPVASIIGRILGK